MYTCVYRLPDRGGVPPEAHPRSALGAADRCEERRLGHFSPAEDVDQEEIVGQQGVGRSDAAGDQGREEELFCERTAVST
jgi:hypothetical protein